MLRNASHVTRRPLKLRSLLRKAWVVWGAVLLVVAVGAATSSAMTSATSVAAAAPAVAMSPGEFNFRTFGTSDAGFWNYSVHWTTSFAPSTVTPGAVDLNAVATAFHVTAQPTLGTGTCADYGNIDYGEGPAFPFAAQLITAWSPAKYNGLGFGPTAWNALTNPAPAEPAISGISYRDHNQQVIDSCEDTPSGPRIISTNIESRAFTGTFSTDGLDTGCYYFDFPRAWNIVEVDGVQSTGVFAEVSIGGANCPPVIRRPANLDVATDPGVCRTTLASLPPFTVWGIPDPTLSVSGVPNGNVFPLGVTTITGTASNGVPADASVSYLVTVSDREKPTISGPADISVVATSPAGAVVNYPAFTSADNCPGVNVTVSHASGTTFPIGDTTVVGTARDNAGNIQSASFKVHVDPPPPPPPPPMPRLTDDAYCVVSNGTLNSDLTKNDDLAGASSYTAELLYNTMLAKNLTFRPNGSFTYRPKANFTGNVMMIYDIVTGPGAKADPAQVKIYVSPSCPSTGVLTGPPPTDSITKPAFPGPVSDRGVSNEPLPPDDGRDLNGGLDITLRHLVAGEPNAPTQIGVYGYKGRVEFDDQKVWFTPGIAYMQLNAPYTLYAVCFEVAYVVSFPPSKQNAGSALVDWTPQVNPGAMGEWDQFPYPAFSVDTIRWEANNCYLANRKFVRHDLPAVQGDAENSAPAAAAVRMRVAVYANRAQYDARSYIPPTQRSPSDPPPPPRPFYDDATYRQRNNLQVLTNAVDYLKTAFCIDKIAKPACDSSYQFEQLFATSNGPGER